MAKKPSNRTNFIFVTGGVVSSLGKGVSAAAIASLLQAHGYKTRIRKLDPYLNIDPGTMSPYEHGEVFVTDDGTETDLDLGHYERFTDVETTKHDNITTGQIYEKLLREERQGGKRTLGRTMQIVPHVTNAIKEFITAELKDEDFLFCEIGGTVGDIESLPFLEAIRQLGFDLGHAKVFHIHMTLLPYLKAAGEYKTKPTQHSVKELLSLGIQPDMLICRAENAFPDKEREKISQFCNVAQADVICAPDLESIYEIPLRYKEQKIDLRILKHFAMTQQTKKSEEVNKKWSKIINTTKNTSKSTNIIVVGKYFGEHNTEYKDSYMSLMEALRHGGIENDIDVNISWLGAEKLESAEFPAEFFENTSGIVIPGGFGVRGSEGKIETIRFAREKKVPFLGICFGMQLAAIEYARNVLGIKKASSTEFLLNGKDDCEAIVCRMEEWIKAQGIERRSLNGDLGGSMRLGGYPCEIMGKDTLAYDIYKNCDSIGEGNMIRERHRHRYEINLNYRERLEQRGMVFSGLATEASMYGKAISEQGIFFDIPRLPEILEIPNHPWFLGVQFHPELQSRPFKAHPIFTHFVRATSKHGLLV